LTEIDSERALFASLVEEHQDYLYSFILGMIGNAEDAKDLASKAFLKGFMAFNTFKHNCSFRTWITTVAINLVKNFRRDKHSALSIEAETEDVGFEPVDSEIGPEGNAIRNENKHKILKALQKLPINLRTCLVLRHLQDLSYEEVSDVTGLPITTVRNRIHQGKIMLKELFEIEGVCTPVEDGYAIA